MIICPSCQKQNQDHYKFCLGCGAELPREAAAQPALDETQKRGVGARIEDEQTNIGIPVWRDPEPAPAAAPGATPPPVPARKVDAPPGLCPECGHPNPVGNRFCAACGLKLPIKGQPAPPKARTKAGTDDLSGAVLTALNPDGTEAGSFPLPKTPTVIGRDSAELFAGDAFLSPKHATFTPRKGGLRVRDEGSLNGVFRRLLADQPFLLVPGQVFRVGQELIRFDLLDPHGPDQSGVEHMGSPMDGYVGRISLVIGRESTGASFPVPETGMNFGRERGEVLFPEDGYVSGLHCRLSHEQGKVYLTDLGSSNGTFVRLAKEEDLSNGDILLMGQQLFRVTI
ncbi:MAG: FHA domain-containing protein [Deltaproteobacteria bacterium]|nr:FHA domain-containing protein [Deltaproteobacteria bacterium]